MAQPPPHSGFLGKGISPGNPDYWTTFITCDSEQQLAGYWGFKSLNIFRRFYLSAFVLPFFIKFVPLRTFQKDKSLALILDLDLREWDDRETDPTDVYDIHEDGIDDRERQIRINYAAALLSMQLWNHVHYMRDSLASDNCDETDEPVRIQKPKELTSVWKEFTDATRLDRPEIQEPQFPWQLLPDFDERASTDKESILEHGNLGLELFCHFEYLLSPTVWESKFIRDQNWSDPYWNDVPLPDGCIPMWMRTQNETPSRTSQPSTLLEEPKTVEVWWNMGSKHERNQQYLQEMQDKEMLLEIPKRALLKVERSMTGKQARDALRKAFRLDEYSGQLQQCGFFFKNNGDQGIYGSTETQICAVNQPWEWNWIQDLLWGEAELLRCYVVLRHRGEGEACFEITPEESRKRKRTE